MYASVYSAVVLGIDGRPVRIEVKLSSGLPALQLVGLPDTTVKEAKERVRSALESAGVRLPAKRITINLAPADLRKAGAHFDLGIAAALAVAIENCTLEALEKSGFLGQLQLDGSIRPISGVLTLVACLKEQGIKRVFVCPENAEEANLIPGITPVPITSVEDLVHVLKGEKAIPVYQEAMEDQAEKRWHGGDFSDVLGQEAAKRAALIAAAGWHNLLLKGSPGCGKTMIAQRMAGIMPDMRFEEQLEVTKVHSVAGLQSNKGLMAMRPFRNPHHTITNASMAGGGSVPRPGELSLASGGILFLDEMPEFKSAVLESLREPLEEYTVRHTRLFGTVAFPADFLLVGAMNPCKCGWVGDREKQCRCTPYEVKRYMGKISGPLLDRFDMIVEMPRVPYREFARRLGDLSTADMKGAVARAAGVQLERQGKWNSRLQPEELMTHCQLDAQAMAFVNHAIRELRLTARGRGRMIRLARTIADVEGAGQIKVTHLAEALQYRIPEKRMQEAYR